MIELRNPYTRLREECLIGHREFARKYEIAKQTLVGMESGQYPSLSDKMIVCLGKECHEKGISARDLLQREYGRSSLQDAYHYWQEVQRRSNWSRLDISLSSLVTNADVSPFLAFMRETAGSIQGFSKAFCLPPATLMRYAKGGTKNMPKAIRDALSEAFDIRPLVLLQEAWMA